MTQPDKPVEDGPATIDRMALERSMDRFFQTNPKDLTDDDLRQFIETQRRLRALYIEKKDD